jgi:hypothetical protein
MKTDELRQEVKQLEAEIKLLLNKFVNRNGECYFKIDVDTIMTQKLDDGSVQFPSIKVNVNITI